MEKLRECKYITYDKSDGEPLAIFDFESDAENEAEKCGCGFCTVPYYPNTSNEPKHETVEQWEARTGDTYPDDGPVWFFQNQSRDYKIALHLEVKYCESGIIIVANHHGKPDSIGER